MEGQKLKEDGDAFRAQLDTKAVFDSWVSRVNQRNFAVTGPIFLLEQIRSEIEESARKLRLRINFQPEFEQIKMLFFRKFQKSHRIFKTYWWKFSFSSLSRMFPENSIKFLSKIPLNFSEKFSNFLKINYFFELCYQQEIITLSKEVRNLKWLGYRVPLTIINKAHQESF